MTEEPYKYFTASLIKEHTQNVRVLLDEQLKREMPRLIKKQLEKIVSDIETAAANGRYWVEAPKPLYDDNKEFLQMRGFVMHYNIDSQKFSIVWDR